MSCCLPGSCTVFEARMATYVLRQGLVDNIYHLGQQQHSVAVSNSVFVVGPFTFGGAISDVASNLPQSNMS